MDNITVFLTPIDVERFKQFQEYYEMFNFLVERKVFEQKGASITLNFDNQGRIGSITRSDVLYLSNKPFVNDNPKLSTVE